MSDHLRRSQAPFGDAAWSAIDEQAAQTLRHYLAGRALVDFAGPKGWTHAAEAVGGMRSLQPGPVDGVESASRVSQPMIESRAPFQLPLSELDRVERGARDANLDALQQAARRAALGEDRTVFHGYPAAGIEGIGPGSPHDPLEISADYSQYPSVVARAVAALRKEGVGGPYAIALGPRCYTGVVETTEHGGYPVLEHMKTILGGPVVWAPGVDGAVVLSRRGGDYTLVVGEDFSVGYRSHTGDAVELYIEETFTLLVHEPAAAVALRYPG